MAILSSKEGKFYDMPEDVLKKYELPAERTSEVLAEFGGEMGPPAGSGPLTIYVTGNGAYIEPSGAAPNAAEGDVEPYRHHHHGGGRGGWGLLRPAGHDRPAIAGAGRPLMPPYRHNP